MADNLSHGQKLQDDEKVEENRILVQELERLENEREQLIKQNDEMTQQYRAQITLLQEKLNQSYQDIQSLATAQALGNQDLSMKALEQMPSQSSPIFDTRDTMDKGSSTARAERRDQECQTDVDMASLDDQINQNKILETKVSLL